MPSRVLVPQPPKEDHAPSSSLEDGAQEKTKSQKITPTAAEPPAAEPAATKAKQATLASFFGKSKVPPTPSVAKDAGNAKKKNKKAAPAKATANKKAAPAKATAKTASKATAESSSATTPATTSANSHKALRQTRPKMDFKHVVVGKASAARKSPPSSAGSSNKPKAAGGKTRKEDFYTLLPRIPPLSEAQARKNPSPDPSILVLSQESDVEEVEAIRLVDKFETSVKESSKPDEAAAQDSVMEDTELIEVVEVKGPPETKPSSQDSTAGKDVEIQEATPEPKVKDNGKSVSKDVETQEAPKEPKAVDDPKRKEEPALVSGANNIQSPPPVGATNSKHLDSEMVAVLHKHETMRVKHSQQASKLVLQARAGFAEETFEIAMPSREGIALLGATDQFSDAAVPHLVCLVEGSKLPLSKLAKKACTALMEAFNGVSFSEEIVTAKIKVLASRKPQVKNPAVASGLPMANNTHKDVNPFEDENSDHMWRWEVTVLELLPAESVKAVKTARAVRRKLQIQFNATARLLAALNESIKLLGDSSGASSKEALKTKVDKVVSKISREEEKVLKFEQEAEKARLAAEAKKQKSAQKQNTCKLEKERQKEEKRKLADEKRKLAEEKKKKIEEDKQKKALEKQQKALAKEEAKRQKEEKERQEKSQKEAAQAKQKKRMMSFFNAPAGKKKPQKEESSPNHAKVASPHSSSNTVILIDDSKSDKFHNSINSLAEIDKTRVFSPLSNQAIASRKRRTKRVKMRVFVSGIRPDDPFAATPSFAEEKIVELRNRKKFLLFQEDCRPPYHGTWSRRNRRLGRKPFSKDSSLNYDVDSEAEWEEGDDDPGEDVENDAGDDEDDKMLDEEGDTRVYNYEDGWMAEDDEIIPVDNDGEMDDETKALVKASKRRVQSIGVPVCIVAPGAGGVPIVEHVKSAEDPMLKERVEGIPAEDGYKIASSFPGTTLVETDLFLDAFPPALVDERDNTAEASPLPSNQPSDEDKKIMARFVHHSKLASKSLVADQFRATHPTVIPNPTQAKRLLDMVAEKKRHPTDGIYWEVKQDVIDALGLGDELMPMVLPKPEPAKQTKKDSKKRKVESTGAENATKKARTENSTKKPKTDKASGSATAVKSGTKKAPVVSKASANMLAAFLKMKK